MTRGEPMQLVSQYEAEDYSVTHEIIPANCSNLPMR